MEIKNTPEIRFKGFEDEWEKKYLGKIVSRKKSYPISRATESSEITDLRYVHYGDIHLGKAKIIDNKSEIPYICSDGYYELLSKGDIILADASEDYEGIGSPAVIVERPKTKIVAATHTIAFSPNVNDSLYLYYQLQSTRYKNFMRKKSTGTKVYGITFNNLSNFEVVFPIIQEQEKIGTLFKNLDNLLALEREKHQKLQEFKRAMLEKMFPREGETVPEIRFDGFEDEWEEIKLGEYSYITTGAMNTDQAEEGGRYPFFIRSEEVLRSNTFLYDEEAILTPGEGKIGEIFHYINGKYTAHQRVYRILDLKKELNAIFLLYDLKRNFKDHALANSSTATAPSIRNSTLSKYKLKIPSLEEQKQIGNFFKHLDEKIENLAQKIEKIEEFKKSLMDKMFV